MKIIKREIFSQDRLLNKVYYHGTQECIAFYTYPEMFVPYDNGYIENPDYDDTVIVFEVPLTWAKHWVKKEGYDSLESFLNEYTWDDTLCMYNDAFRDGTLYNDCGRIRTESR